MRNWVKSNNKPLKTQQQHKQKVWKQKREANEANGELSETDLKSEETVRRWRTSWTLHANGRGGKFCRVTCYFEMAKKEKAQFAVKKRSWWSTSDRKQMKQQLQKNSNPMKRFQRKMWKIRRFIEEISTSNGERQRWKDLSKQTQICIRDKKRAKNKRFNEYWKTSKESGTFQESNLQQEEFSSPRWRTRNVKSLQ